MWTWCPSAHCAKGIRREPFTSIEEHIMNIRLCVLFFFYVIMFAITAYIHTVRWVGTALNKYYYVNVKKKITNTIRKTRHSHIILLDKYTHIHIHTFMNTQRVEIVRATSVLMKREYYLHYHPTRNACLLPNCLQTIGWIPKPF